MNYPDKLGEAVSRTVYHSFPFPVNFHFRFHSFPFIPVHFHSFLFNPIRYYSFPADMPRHVSMLILIGHSLSRRGMLEQPAEKHRNIMEDMHIDVIYVCISMYLYIYTHIYMYTYIYIHTYKYIRSIHVYITNAQIHMYILCMLYVECNIYMYRHVYPAYIIHSI